MNNIKRVKPKESFDKQHSSNLMIGRLDYKTEKKSLHHIIMFNYR